MEKIFSSVGIVPSGGFLRNDKFNQCLFSPDGGYRICVVKVFDQTYPSRQLILYQSDVKKDAFPYLETSISISDTGVTNVFQSTIINVYLKTNRASNSCLNIPNNNQVSGTVLGYATCVFNNDASQYFKFYDFSGGYYVIRSNTELCFDLRFSDTTNGNSIWLYTCNGAHAQTWKLENIGAGFWNIKSKLNLNKCITADSAGRTIISDCILADTSQKWYFGNCDAGECRHTIILVSFVLIMC